MDRYVLAMLFLDALLVYKSVQSANCAKTDFDRCIKTAEPLIKQVHLIFPDNMEDIDMMCTIWNNFVDCLYKYTDKCFTDGQRREFKTAIERPLESVHKLCTQKSYQREYLVNAPCMKSTVAEGGRCSPYYSLMLEAVEPLEISQTASCCSHHRFKECVMSETKLLCDRGVHNGPASRFSTEIISNLFSSTAKCANYIPNSADCPLPTESIQIVSSPSETYPLSATQFRGKSPKELPASDVLLSKPITTWLPPSDEPSFKPSKPITAWFPPSSEPSFKPSKPVIEWLPPSSEPSANPDTPLPAASNPFAPKPVTTWLPSPVPNITEDSSIINKHLITPETLGSRSRPSSYGRASSWSSEDVTQPSQNSEAVSKWGGAKSSEITESWASLSTTWYPAAGSQLSNEVDEPNQLGLVKREHNEAATYDVFCLKLLIILPILRQFGV